MPASLQRNSAEAFTGTGSPCFECQRSLLSLVFTDSLAAIAFPPL